MNIIKFFLNAAHIYLSWMCMMATAYKEYLIFFNILN